MYLIFDAETTGLPKDYKAPWSDSANWPRMVQIAWQLHNDKGELIENQDFLIYPDGFNIPFSAEEIHGISTDLALEQGQNLAEVLQKFNEVLQKTTYIVGHNVEFDINIIGAEFYRLGIETNLSEIKVLNTSEEGTANLCQLPGGRGKKFKFPTLTELYQHLFGEIFKEAHNATADVEATARCFFELLRIGEGFAYNLLAKEYFDKVAEANPTTIGLYGIEHQSLKEASAEIYRRNQKEEAKQSEFQNQQNAELLKDAVFAHLHNHSQFSVLQSTISIKDLISEASKQRMPAVALTDFHTMMGAFIFVKEVLKHNKELPQKNENLRTDYQTSKEKAKEEGIEFNKPEPKPFIELKPIVGSEFFVCENHKDKTRKDNGYQIVVLAKNKKGYENLVKMASISYIDGNYYVPRIDKEVLTEYKDDLIVLSGGLQGEIYSKINNVGEKQAEDALLWWKQTFKDDFYLEILRHGLQEEDRANKVIVGFAKKHNVKLVATNNTFYIKEEDASAHDILLCVKEGEKQQTPIGKGRGERFGLEPMGAYNFKTSAQMKKLFVDLPEAILSIQEIIDKVEIYKLEREVLLPKFDIPDEFKVEDDPTGKKGENQFLKHLTYLGAEKRYKNFTPEVKERIDFELDTIEMTGYPGYFLIVQDFIAKAREMGISVGPGRGSAAGSVVAYCLGITNIDPIEYGLLFERFLNPERVSLPDIDVDFEDEGRAQVIDYVINKYGKNQVAQIITYGKMAAKSSIRDTARVLDLSLKDSNELAKKVPQLKKMKLKDLAEASDNALKKETKTSEEYEKATQFISLSQKNDLEGETIRQAMILEGSLRNTGTHACGIIITPSDITSLVPVATSKDSLLLITQFDNSVAEEAGLLKMDFLGLKNLTTIKDAVEIIKQTKGEIIDPETFPIDDKNTYKLFQEGQTIGIFQYESAGMQKYMRDLKPTVFADLIAMNALYRPGPLEYIPSFIRRKHGTEAISYDLDDMEEFLKETYGITVYQEQVMLLSQKLAGFTKGEADNLRKAMGKKQKAVLDKMKPKFISQAEEKGYERAKLEKIWQDWEAFAEYAFNKSHSTCYAWVAYQTAYLKANYPAEYMAALLSGSMRDIKQVSFFLEECKRMNISVLPPCVNESEYKFTVNKQGDIRFGMGAIKGVGEAAVEAIISERKKSTPYESVFDFVSRVDLRACNKKTLESIVLAGGFDSVFSGDMHRAQFFFKEDNNEKTPTFLEKIISYGNKVQSEKESVKLSLFGEDNEEMKLQPPKLPKCNKWSEFDKLKKEKEVVGLYISAHPLDRYKFEIKYFCNTPSNFDPNHLEPHLGRQFALAGIVSKLEVREGKKNGEQWAIFNIEGYDNSFEFRIFKNDFRKFRHLLAENSFVYLRFSIIQYQYSQESAVSIRLNWLDICDLSEVMEKKAEKLTIILNIEDISSATISKIAEILKNSEEETKKIPLSFKIYQVEENEIPSITSEETFSAEENDTDEEIYDYPSEENNASEDDNQDTFEEEHSSEKQEKDALKSHRVTTMLGMLSRNMRVNINYNVLSQLEEQKISFTI